MNCVDAIININSEEYLYVGSCKKLKKRITTHKAESKRAPNRKLYKYINFFGWDNVKFKILCDNVVIPEDNDIILRLIEEQYRKLLKPSLNHQICCVESDYKTHLSTKVKCKYCNVFVQRWNMSNHVHKWCKKTIQPDDETLTWVKVEKIKTPEISDIPLD